MSRRAQAASADSAYVEAADRSSPTISMTDDATAQEVTLNIKGPSALKLSTTVPVSITVQQLKEKIAELNKDFPAERYAGHAGSALTPFSQRLIYSGKVLKDAGLTVSGFARTKVGA